MTLKEKFPRRKTKNKKRKSRNHPINLINWKNNESQENVIGDCFQSTLESARGEGG